MTCIVSLMVFLAGAAPNEGQPANTWVKVSEENAGGTIGAIVYVPDLKGSLLYGYPAPASRSDVDLFLTATREWQGQVPKGPHLPRGACFTVWKDGRPMLPCINRDYWLANQACYVPTTKKVLYFAGASTFYYNPSPSQGEGRVRVETAPLSPARPLRGSPEGRGGVWEDLRIPCDQAPPDVMLGTMAWDPVKKRVILFGGGYISAAKGAGGDTGVTAKPLGTPWTRGTWTMAEKRATWAFDPEKKAWSKVVTGSDKFREANAKCLALDERNTDLMGSIRGIALEYGDMMTGQKAAELAEVAGQLAADAAALAKALAAGGGCDDAYEKAQCAAAAAELEKAKADLDAAKAALADDPSAAAAPTPPSVGPGVGARPAPDGWRALRAAEKARSELAAAAEAVAASPLPRYYSSLVTDTKNNLLVLFGGHGGTMALGDTWVFDPAKDQWRMSRSAAHPPLAVMVCMDFDAKAGLVFHAGGWVYDAAKDEWRTVTLSGDAKLFHPWRTMVYDPVEDAHVLMTAAHGTFGDFGPRRTLLLRLDASGAQEAKPGGRTWAWLNDKYDVAWSKLPKTQAEYKAAVADQKKFLDGLPPNQWVKRNAPYDCQNRGYGSFCYDWDRDQVVNWGGGHSAYMGNEMSQYDVKSNRWMESWPPDLPPWPFGAPDGAGWDPPLYHVKCSSHGYHYYVYCSDLKKIIFYSSGPIYDPDRMRYTGLSIKRVGTGSVGNSVDMSGAPGVMAASGQYYRGAPFGVWKADLKEMSLARIAGSDPAFGSNDRNKPVFDPKRNRILWFGVQSGKNKVCNELWAFPLETGKWQDLNPIIDPAGAQVPGMGDWGNCYSPKHDLMVILPGPNNAGTWVYDCQKNVLKRQGDAPETRQGTCGVIYNAKQDVFIAMQVGGYGVGPVSLHFMRYKS